MARDKRMEAARQDGADHLQPFVDIRADLCSALVALTELVAGILGKSLHALADATLSVAERLEDRIHSPLQLGELLDAHLMHFIRAEVCRCRGLQRPAIIF